MNYIKKRSVSAFGPWDFPSFLRYRPPPVSRNQVIAFLADPRNILLSSSRKRLIRVVAFVHVLNEKDLATENDAQEASECMRGAAWCCMVGINKTRTYGGTLWSWPSQSIVDTGRHGRRWGISALINSSSVTVNQFWLYALSRLNVSWENQVTTEASL